MNDQKKNENRHIWMTVLISAAVALVVSLLVTAAFNIPVLLSFFSKPVPQFEGMTIKEAQLLSTKYHLVLTTVDEEPSEIKKGTILTQEPKAGTRLKRGEEIRVVVSSGKPTVKMPDLGGFDLIHATEMLQATGLFVEDVISKHDTMLEDLVIYTEPASGSPVEKGSKIILFVSLGPSEVEVPKVTGKRLTEAKSILEEKGFSLGDIRYEVTTEYYQGIIMRQTPKAGEKAAKGSEVDLVVAGVLR